MQSTWPLARTSEQMAETLPPPPKWTELLKKHLNEFKLTYKQKSAVNRLYLENQQGESIGEVTKKLRISVDSLKDRIAQVKKKVLARFPEAAEAEDAAVLPDKKKKEKFESDLSFGGFFRKSSAKFRHSVYRVDLADPSNRVEIQNHSKAKLNRKKDLPKKERDALDALRNQEELTGYVPTHNGIFSPWIPMGPKGKKNKSTWLIDASDYRRKLSRLRDYEK